MNTVLFDLDGTMLSIDDDVFMENYVSLLKSHFSSCGYDEKKVIKAVFSGLDAMRKNNGMVTNDVCFWNTVKPLIADMGGSTPERNARKIEREMLEFYDDEFNVIRFYSQVNPLVEKTLLRIKEKGYTLVCATDPVFPEFVLRSRIKWAGVDPDIFNYITGYENSCFCKPNMEYYRYILRVLERDPEDCLMVGNDVLEDMSASSIGISTYLITGHVINNHNESLYGLRKGSWEDFYNLAETWPEVY